MWTIPEHTGFDPSMCSNGAWLLPSHLVTGFQSRSLIRFLSNHKTHYLGKLMLLKSASFSTASTDWATIIFFLMLNEEIHCFPASLQGCIRNSGSIWITAVPSAWGQCETLTPSCWVQKVGALVGETTLSKFDLWILKPRSQHKLQGNSKQLSYHCCLF